MKFFNQHQEYISCIQKLLLETFKEKNLCIQFFMALIGLIAGLLFTLMCPIILKKAVDSFSDFSICSVTLITLSYGLIWVLSQLSLQLRDLLTYKIEQRLIFVLGFQLTEHLFGLSQSYFLDQKSGAIVNVIRRAQQNIPSIFLGIFFHVLPTLFEFLFVIILISKLYPLRFDFLLGGTFISFFIFTIYSLNFSLKDREAANRIDRNVDGTINDWLLNHLAVKTFGQENLALTVCKKELKKREEAEIVVMKRVSYFRIGQSLILGLGLTATTYFVGEGVLSRTLTIGDFVLFNGYILQFIIPITILGNALQDIKKALIDMKGVIGILLTKSEIKEVSHPTRLSGPHFQVRFKNVSFRYRDRYVLQNVSFTIEPGETIVIVGPTGAGKSTLAKLLLRLHDPSDGEILLNQINIKELSFQSLYDTIGWISQDTYLLNDTIENNIRFANPEASLEDIKNALENAHLLRSIEALPQGIGTLVGDRGLKLSGGEKQRIALARLFLKKPRICIFDEATSFLDRKTELVIQKNIDKSLAGITKIIITHRPFMIHKADKIFSLKDHLVHVKRNPAELTSWFREDFQPKQAQ